MKHTYILTNTFRHMYVSICLLLTSAYDMCTNINEIYCLLQVHCSLILNNLQAFDKWQATKWVGSYQRPVIFNIVHIHCRSSSLRVCQRRYFHCVYELITSTTPVCLCALTLKCWWRLVFFFKGCYVTLCLQIHNIPALTLT